ncbi:MAG TPA: FtsX-like permease family protein, partial [Patescibacteria group bacterium]|nr:FtsX-like permease family protein [Patescibacteria group bacterium]
RSPEQLKASAQGRLLLVLIATGIALAVVINLATYFASRQPAFTELAGILHMLGAPLARQYGLALSEPLLITLGAMATAMVCHALIARSLEDFIGDPELLSGALANYAMAGVVVALSMAALRVHHVLRSGRAGVVSARRWSARLYPFFLGAQVMAAAVIVAVAAISLLHWQRIQPGQYAFDLDRTWHLTFAAGSAPVDAASANQRFEAAVLDAQSDGDIELALSTADAPLVQWVRERRAEDEAGGHPDDLAAVVAYASVNWLDLIGIATTPVANGLATPGRDAAVVNRRFMTARWPEGAPEFPYLVPPRAPVRRGVSTPQTNEDDPPPASDRILPIAAVFSEKKEGRADLDDLIQPTVLLPLHRRPEQPLYRLSGLLRTREARTAAWVRQRAMRFERLIGLPVRTVEPARAVVDRGVENERRRAELYAQLAAATLVVTLSGMMALCAAMAMSMRRELATRFSLGWSRRAVVGTLLVRLARPIAIGSALGLVLGAVGLQILTRQTPGLSNLQAAALIATAVVLVAAGAIAVFQPLREALQARFAMWLRDE